MLGNPGSNPLELFWDAVDVLDQQLDARIAVVEGAIRRHNLNVPDAPSVTGQGDADVEMKDGEKDQGFSVGPDTSEEEFRSIMAANADDAVKALSDQDLHVVFKSVSSPVAVLV